MSSEGSQRKTVSVSKSAFDRCEGVKEDDESWSVFFERAADALESSEGGGEQVLNTLTPEHIDDIANATASKTVEEFETRLR